MLKTTFFTLIGITQGAESPPHMITYPSPREIMQMRLNSRGIGEDECSQPASSDFCADYIKYWKDETPSIIDEQLTPALSGAVPTTAEAKKIRESNLAAGQVVGKILIAVVGGTFRRKSDGNVFARENKGPKEEIIAEQKKAADSHAAFGRFLKNFWGVEADFVVAENRPDEFKEFPLESWYPDGTRIISGECTSLGSRLAMAVASTDLTGYGGVLFLRADISLKPFFFETFKLFDTITYGYVQPVFFEKARRLADDGFEFGVVELETYEWIDDHTLYVPKRLFSHLYFKVGKPAVPLTPRASLYALRDGVTSVHFMTNTIHITGTEKNKNPLYRVVNRVEGEFSPWSVLSDKVLTTELANLADNFFRHPAYLERQRNWLAQDYSDWTLAKMGIIYRIDVVEVCSNIDISVTKGSGVLVPWSSEVCGLPPAGVLPQDCSAPTELVSDFAGGLLFTRVCPSGDAKKSLLATTCCVSNIAEVQACHSGFGLEPHQWTRSIYRADRYGLSASEIEGFKALRNDPSVLRAFALIEKPVTIRGQPRRFASPSIVAEYFEGQSLADYLKLKANDPEASAEVNCVILKILKSVERLASAGHALGASLQAESAIVSTNKQSEGCPDFKVAYLSFYSEIGSREDVGDSIGTLLVGSLGQPGLDDFLTVTSDDGSSRILIRPTEPVKQLVKSLISSYGYPSYAAPDPSPERFWSETLRQALPPAEDTTAANEDKKGEKSDVAIDKTVDQVSAEDEAKDKDGEQLGARGAQGDKDEPLRYKQQSGAGSAHGRAVGNQPVTGSSVQPKDKNNEGGLQTLHVVLIAVASVAILGAVGALCVL